MTLQIADGDMHVLTGFGELPLVMRPRTTRNPDGHGDTVSPARPTVIGTLAIVRLMVERDTDRTLVFMRNHKRIWYELQERELFDDEIAACKPIAPPRLVTVRIFSYNIGAYQPGHELNHFMLVDEALGRPILGIHNRILKGHEKRAAGPSEYNPSRASRIVGVTTYFESACEWHPDGYDPPWLASVA